MAKIADFGFVRLLTDEALSLRGTPLWTAPEILRGDTYTEKADVYSFGIGTTINIFSDATRSDVILL